MATPKRCKECGAQLTRSATCPLCGADPGGSLSPAPRKDVDRYQKDVRKLRAELKRLRRNVETG
ncbi:MAG: hypothetical protein M3280_09145 [Actinomycetota bacterium]|nr:hypothetical protein [Actinomycetota bacterium]